MSEMVDKFTLFALYDQRRMFEDRGWGLRPVLGDEGDGKMVSEWRLASAGVLEDAECVGCSRPVGPLGWVRSVGVEGGWDYCPGCASSELKKASDAESLSAVVEFYDLTENELYPVRVDNADRVTEKDVM